MIETLCGDPRTIERVRQRVHAMVANLDVFQLRPGIDDLLRKLRKLGLKLGLVANHPDPDSASCSRADRRRLGSLFD